MNLLLYLVISPLILILLRNNIILSFKYFIKNLGNNLFKLYYRIYYILNNYSFINNPKDI